MRAQDAAEAGGRGFWRGLKDWLVLALVGIAGLGAAGTTYRLESAADTARVRGVLELHAEWRARDFERKLALSVTTVEPLAIALRASEGRLDAGQFHRMAALAHGTDQSTRRVVFLPRVRRDPASGETATPWGETLPRGFIRESAPDGAFVAAGERSEYFPVLLEEIFEPTPSVRGLDLLANPARKAAAERARDEGRPIATPPVTFLTGKDLRGYLVFWPVYAGGETPTALEERRSKLLGYAVGTFRLEAVLNDALRNTPEILGTFRFFTEATGAHPVAVFDRGAGVVRSVEGKLEPGPLPGGERITRSLQVFGNEWRMVFDFGPEVVADLESPGAWGWLALGVLLTGLLVGYMGRERWRKLLIEKAVIARTVELRAEVEARQAAQQQLVQAQKMEALGNLTGGLSHDFNNLLGIVIGNLDLLKERLAGDPEAAELLEEALEASLRGADLNRSLLAFARRQPLQPRQVDLTELVASTAKLLTRALGEEIEVVIATAAKLWPVTVDPAQLESALTNLAVNARDAMPAGGRLTISTRNTPLDSDYAAHAEVPPGDYVAIEVSDTGTGMTPEVLARAFEPFFTTKGLGEGTGLGLSMVFGFVKQSGGHIKIYSEAGLGTTFRLFLPRASAAQDAEPEEQRTLEQRGSGTILAVEDNEGLRRILVKQLAELGYDVIQAENAKSALEVLGSGRRIDLMLTDIVMPGGVNGWELARQAGGMRPGLKLLFTSGFPEASLGAKEPIPEGASLLSKPYRKAELAEKVRAALAA